MARGPKRRPIAERFWEKVTIKGPDDCWEWQGCINPKTGYGNFGLKINGHNTNRGAHRIAFALSGGDCSKFVCHKCDNPPCCNPNHLWSGTVIENARDSRRKGRHSRTRLTLKQVKLIRMLRPYVTLENLAKEFNVTLSTIHHAEKGISWADL